MPFIVTKASLTDPERLSGPDDLSLLTTEPQTLTPSQQAQVRANIGAFAEADLSDVSLAINALTGAAGSFIRFDGPNDDDAVMQAIVGTVSQAGGIPTGSIIETGTNANGTYVRFADGTQICWNNAIAAANTNTATGALFITTTSPVWTFPAAFSAVPVVLPGQSGSANGTRWTVLGTVTTTDVIVRNMSTIQSTTTTTITAAAIGRWF